jgi:hypothetical protein
MGRNFSDDLSFMDSLSLETQLSIHLSSNCYPPIPQFMVSVAVEAIAKYNADEGDSVINLPAGVQFRNGQTITAFDAIQSLHLESWCNENWEN